MPIDDLAEIDYSLNSLPAVFRPYIELDLKVIACSASANIDGFFLFLYDPLSKIEDACCSEH